MGVLFPTSPSCPVPCSPVLGVGVLLLCISPAVGPTSCSWHGAAGDVWHTQPEAAQVENAHLRQLGIPTAVLPASPAPGTQAKGHIGLCVAAEGLPQARMLWVEVR